MNDHIETRAEKLRNEAREESRRPDPNDLIPCQACGATRHWQVLITCPICDMGFCPGDCFSDHRVTCGE